MRSIKEKFPVMHTIFYEEGGTTPTPMSIGNLDSTITNPNLGSANHMTNHTKMLDSENPDITRNMCRAEDLNKTG